MPTLTRRRIIVVSLVAGGAALFIGGSMAALLYMKDRGLQGGTLQLDAPPRFDWRSVDKKHWQAVAALEEETTVTDAREANRGACGSGMVEARGKHLLDSASHDTSGEVEELQNRACTNWISKDFPARCQTFDRAQWLELSAKLPRRDMSFCVDRFEYPNVKGANPVIVVTYTEAQNLCKASNKRLCTETEWTYACEGDEGAPYPYGYDRDPDACVVDRPWKQFSSTAMSPRDGAQARRELDRLWQGLPSGSRAGCKSPTGVYDMTGNVDEWTKTVRTGGYASVLKGGYWGPVRARCRPATRAHNEQFVAYQQGFRCCADVGTTVAAPPKPVAPAASGSSSVAATAPVDAGKRAAREEAGVAVAAAPASAGVPLADDTDEDESIAVKEGDGLKPKIGLTCGVTPSGAGSAPVDPSGALVPGVAIALLLARRRERARALTRG